MKKIDTVKSYWAAEGNQDLADVLDHFSQTAVFRSPGTTLTGRENIREFYKGIINNYKHVRVTPTHWIEQNDEIAVEYDFELITHSDEKKTGCGFNLFEIIDEKIHFLRCYFNPADF